MHVQQPPVIIVPAPVVNLPPSEGLPGWVAPILGLAGVLLGAVLGLFLSRSRDYEKWLWEKRSDLYAKLGSILALDDLSYKLGSGAGVGGPPKEPLRERMGTDLEVALTMFGSSDLEELRSIYEAADDEVRNSEHDDGSALAKARLALADLILKIYQEVQFPPPHTWARRGRGPETFLDQYSGETWTVVRTFYKVSP